MADCSSDQKKSNTGRTSPSEIDHADIDKLSADNVSDKMPGKKTGHCDQDIDKDRKNIASGNRVK